LPDQIARGSAGFPPGKPLLGATGGAQTPLLQRVGSMTRMSPRNPVPAKPRFSPDKQALLAVDVRRAY